MVYRVKGWASRPIRDNEDHLVALKSLTWTKGAVPLLHEHEEGKVAGTIINLQWASEGLWIECDVADEYAANVAAFSCRFAVRKHRIIGKGQDAYAIVERGVLREVSLVARPCCKGAIATSCERIETTRPAATEWNTKEFEARRVERAVQLNYWLSQVRSAK